MGSCPPPPPRLPSGLIHIPGRSAEPEPHFGPHPRPPRSSWVVDGGMVYFKTEATAAKSAEVPSMRLISECLSYGGSRVLPSCRHAIPRSACSRIDSPTAVLACVSPATELERIV